MWFDRFHGRWSRIFLDFFDRLFFSRTALDLQTDQFRAYGDLFTDFAIDGDDLAAA
ncbi:hypothetical protein D9M68_952810 [compost metagenome]